MVPKKREAFHFWSEHFCWMGQHPFHIVAKSVRDMQLKTETVYYKSAQQYREYITKYVENSCMWLYSSMVLHKDLCCNFPFVLASCKT